MSWSNATGNIFLDCWRDAMERTTLLSRPLNSIGLSIRSNRSLSIETRGKMPGGGLTILFRRRSNQHEPYDP